MALSIRTVGIVSASVIAIGLVGFSYAITGAHPLLALGTANAESTDALLKNYAAKDTDGDGLPDWQEALYGTDPSNPHSFRADITDGQAVSQNLIKPKFTSAVASSTPVDSLSGIQAPAAGSITEQFANEFRQEVLVNTGGQPLSDTDKQALISKLIDVYSTRASAAFTSPYSSVDVHTSLSATTASYVAGVERALTSHDVKGVQPLDDMNAYVQNGDQTAKAHLVKVSAAYQAIGADVRALSVPPSLVDTQVALVQGLDLLAKTTGTVPKYQADPIASIGAVSAYVGGTKTFSGALSDLANAVLAGGEPAAGEPGYLIVAISRL